MVARGKLAPPTERQTEVFLAYVEHRSYRLAGLALGINPHAVMDAVHGFVKRARRIPPLGTGRA